jgi:hypothetical protein
VNTLEDTTIHYGAPHTNGLVNVQVQAQILKLLQYHEGKIDNNPTRLNFLVYLNKEKSEEVTTYNKLLEYLSSDK